MIPREDLFAEPERSQLRISPDGRWLAWLSVGAGVSNLWAAPLQDPTQARPLTFDGRRGISSYRWSWRPGLLLFAQDRDGDENWRLYAVAADGGAARPLTPAGGVRASLAAVSRLHPDTVLVSLNARDPRWPDLYRLELESATLTLHQANPGMARFVIDDDYRVRLAVRNEADGGATVLRRHEGDWRPWLSYPAEDARTSGPSHYGGDGERLYLYDSRGRDTAALYEVAGAAGTLRLMAADPLADLGGLLTDAAEHRPGAVALTRLRPSWLALQPSLQEELDWLEQRLPGQWTLDSRSGDDRLWLLQSGDDDDPGASWLYRRDRRRLERLQLHRPRLAGRPLARMRPQLIGARDGLALVAYLSLPIEAEIAPAWAARPLPLVLLVHGGPWSRDGFGYNALHQWLANRGYAVLSVNFRGSIGFGKAFLDAGNGEWGRRMDEDLEDAVQWAIDRGIADPARLAIFGASYGGYAVLSALTRYPDRYACGIDVVGPSNLETLLAAIPPYWEAARAMQYRAIGNPETEHGRALLRERSPLHRAGRIRAPLLIAQGGNDPRVKQAESERMVAALRGNGIAVEYALYPDEGHGFVRESNRMSFNALAEAFLARHLGGRAEPAPAGGFPGSSLRLC
ncbi:S9 family peptidase [Xanthomonas theicola]|uniref:S9 family peptidase n=1 Tax=Xanthomonas theicola TaxID=56464 RepID=A0A2S6ZCB2_9XANT|nr:S9 family peptidase [Xanthomonas theicola]QNH26940.1 S9 family peptidase [Xanthomonas theicola]